MTAGQIRRLNSGSAGIIDAARCPACNHHARVHNVVGCVSAHCECAVTRAELMPDAPRLEVPDGIESTPAVKAEAPTDGGSGDAAQGRPVEADAPASAPVVPVRPSSGWDPPKLPRRTPARPAAPTAQGYAAVVGGHDAVEEVTAGSGATGPAVTDPHTPGAGWARVKAELGDLVPDLTEEDERDLDRFLGSAAPLAPGEVRFGPLPATVHATPAPLDLTPFLSAALYYYPAWFCRSCLQRRHNPGVHCRRPLQPVYVVIAPRSTT